MGYHYLFNVLLPSGISLGDWVPLFLLFFHERHALDTDMTNHKRKQVANTANALYWSAVIVSMSCKKLWIFYFMPSYPNFQHSLSYKWSTFHVIRWAELSIPDLWMFYAPFATLHCGRIFMGYKVSPRSSWKMIRVSFDSMPKLMSKFKV